MAASPDETQSQALNMILKLRHHARVHHAASGPPLPHFNHSQYNRVDSVIPSRIQPKSQRDEIYHKLWRNSYVRGGRKNIVLVTNRISVHLLLSPSAALRCERSPFLFLFLFTPRRRNRKRFLIVHFFLWRISASLWCRGYQRAR